jgi:hypothetical protein
MRSLAVTSGASVPVISMRIVFGFCSSTTCASIAPVCTVLPTPSASVPNAPSVAVWLSPQTITMPGAR